MRVNGPLKSPSTIAAAQLLTFSPAEKCHSSTVGLNSALKLVPGLVAPGVAARASGVHGESGPSRQVRERGATT